ncbi:MAG: ABC transporter ATP-binding protein [Anaerolineae bacterium]|nr:ABC transporter ATP-binding protein [Anaerolineae bacterium]
MSVVTNGKNGRVPPPLEIDNQTAEETPGVLNARKASLVASLERLSDKEDKIGQSYNAHLASRLLQYLAPYKRPVILAFIFQAMQAVASVAGPPLVRLAIDHGMIERNMQALLLYSGLFLFAALVEFFSTNRRVIYMGNVANDVIFDLRTQLYAHLQRMTLSFYDHFVVGRLMSRLLSDVGTIQDFVTWSFVGVFRSIAILIGIIVAMFLMDVKLSLLTLAVIPVMILATALWRKHVREAFRVALRRRSLVTGNFAENINGVRVVQAFSREPRNLARFMELNRAHQQANLRSALLSGVFFPGVDILGSIATILVILYGGGQVLRGELTPGVLVAFVLFVERFFEPIRDLAQRYNTLQNTMSSSERLFELLDTPPAFSDAPNAYDLPPVQGAVELRDVTFSYDGRKPVLKHISLQVQPGMTVAFVGETGAGKSSIVSLLSRFYEIDQGQILIDGHDVQKIRMASLRSQMAVVLQQPFLFAGSISDNIRYGRLNATDAEIQAAAEAVGAHQFIMGTEQGYQTKISEGGTNLSVGQRQLVSFARALLADPRILILDEATSSVDTQTEQIIQAALKRLLQGRTAFVIAHRLSTIVNADLICVVDHGEIVERGTHQELLAHHGQYYDLYTMQWAARQAA